MDKVEVVDPAITTILVPVFYQAQMTEALENAGASDREISRIWDAVREDYEIPQYSSKFAIAVPMRRVLDVIRRISVYEDEVVRAVSHGLPVTSYMFFDE